MGGKGGGGGGEPGWMPYWKADQARIAKEKEAADAAAAAAKAAQPAPAPAAAPAPEPAAAAAPAAAEPVAQGTPLDAGGAVDQPTGGNSESMGLGDALGGAVLKPPQYWVGGVDSYNVADTATGRNAGSLKTTQT